MCSVGTPDSNYPVSSCCMLNTIYLSTWLLPSSLIVGNELKVHLIMYKFSKPWHTIDCQNRSLNEEDAARVRAIINVIFPVQHVTARPACQAPFFRLSFFASSLSLAIFSPRVFVFLFQGENEHSICVIVLFFLSAAVILLLPCHSNICY